MFQKSSQEHYNQLYNLQDEVLRIAEKTSFYLTGGTALSRFYLNHRYSDDLDFFTNDSASYRKQADIFLKELKNSYEMRTAVITDSFAQVFVSSGGIDLKIDTVLDVPYRAETPAAFPEFSRVDSLKNILSNKICALSRQAAKDVADIVFICRRLDFAWDEIIGYAMKKEILEELYVMDLLRTFPVEELKTIKWISEPDFGIFEQNVKQIVKDIASKSVNSLYAPGTEGSA